jgi:malonyl-CoA O-methyltransferase
MIDKKQVVRHFSNAAKSYDNYATVQKIMAIELENLMISHGKFNNILEIGCGTGFFTKLLAKQYPNAKIIATDISPAMLATAKENLTSYHNISYQLMDGEKIHFHHKFDLIISNAAFQWFINYEGAFKSFHDHLATDGYLMYTTFGTKTFTELNTSFQYAFKINHIDKEVHHGPQFKDINFLKSIATKSDLNGYYHEAIHRDFFPNAKDFLHTIKKIGANNSAPAKDVLLTRNVLLQLLQYYQNNYTENHQVYATYHIIYACQQRFDDLNGKIKKI